MSLPGPMDLGVVVGRFQVPSLHEGHKKLLNMVFARHKRVLILLGNSAWVGGIRNPLDYPTRKAMMLEAYPTALVSHVKDQQTNEIWSNEVDRIIRDLFPFGKVTLYGGRDGFTSSYCGQYSTVETMEDPSYETTSGTDIRASAAALPINSPDFRAGVIYATYAIPDGVKMCVDGAIIKSPDAVHGAQLLLIRKALESKWRFPGGHLEPGDSSLETAVIRESREETGVEVGTPEYIGSQGRLPDWRAERAGIGISSSLFYLPYVYGAAKGMDDAAEAKWFDMSSVNEDNMEPCHKGFIRMLLEWYERTDK